MENVDPRAEFRRMDIRGSEFVQTCHTFQPEVIVHLAAQASVARSLADPATTASINVDGTRAVARAACDVGVTRLVFASTAAVYGVPAALPLTETSATVPINPYGESKLAAERLLETELRESETDFAIARFANVYGPRQDSAGEGGVVSVFCDSLAAGGGLNIHGDGEQTRDFIYVADIVSALVSFIGGDIYFCQRADVPAAGIYNISTGTRISVNDLALRLRRLSGSAAEVSHSAAREGDIRDSVLSPAKAHEVFEWQAGIDLEQGLTNTWRWFERRHRESTPVQ
jgi:UDP-glucose 4-epimerase